MRGYQFYKNSGIDWIGKIPEHWSSTKLKYIGTLYNGLSGKTGDDFRSEDEILNKPFIKFTNICNHTYIPKNDFGIVRINNGEVQNRVQKNDIFFLMTSETQEDVGKTSCLKDDVDELYLNSFCKGFRLKVDDIYPSFLNYLLLGHSYRKILSIEGVGFTRVNLRQEKVNDLKVFLPSYQEQIRIVEFLDNKTDIIDDLISTKERKIELLKEQRTSLINQVITKGLDPHVKMKDSGIDWIGEIPEHWIMKKIKHLRSNDKYSLVDGPFGSNLKTEHYVENGDVYVVESGFITTGEFKYVREFKTITFEHYVTIKRSECTEGNIIISKIGENYGMSGILPKLDKISVISGNSISLKLSELNNTKFIHKVLLLHRINGTFKKEVQQTGQPFISLGVVDNLQIPVPPLKEQEEIIKYLNTQTQEVDKMILLEQKKIDLLKEYRHSLISEVVTGKIDVRTNVN